MLFKKLQLVLVLGLFGLGLAACGDSDSPSTTATSTPSASSDGPMAANADGTLPDYDPDVPSMVVEDNGVVHY